jgi:ABC-type oligopeptide transport system substrate-binding subunit
LEGLPGDAGALVPQEPGVGDAGTGDDGPGPGTEEEAPDLAEVIGPITLTHNRGATHTAVAERMATDIEEALGLEVDFQAQDLQPFIQGVRSGDTPVFRLGWDVAGPDAGAYLYPLFHSSQVGVDNLTSYENEEVDGLLEAARVSDDDLERRRLYREAEMAILEDAPAIPLLWSRLRLVIAPEVQDLVVTPFGRFGLRDAWLEPAVP